MELNKRKEEKKEIEELKDQIFNFVQKDAKIPYDKLLLIVAYFIGDEYILDRFKEDLGYYGTSKEDILALKRLLKELQEASI